MKKNRFWWLLAIMLVFGLICCDNGSSGSGEEDVDLIGTTWKTSVTETISGVVETYDVFLAFGSGIVNINDNSSVPSNENGIYSVKGESVTITISPIGILNKKGSISNNELKIDLGMGLMTFIKQ